MVTKTLRNIFFLEICSALGADPGLLFRGGAKDYLRAHTLPPQNPKSPLAGVKGPHPVS